IMECTISDGGKLVITIEDNGVGIGDVEKAMEPMFSTGDSEERSGMGFTVMESFTDRLKVRSEIGKGTTVIMTKYLDIISGI
ncbi:MAG: ATP-binding protein, partial [Lentihominibacter sp.]